MALFTVLENQSFCSAIESAKMLVFDERKYGQLKSAVYHGNKDLIETLLEAGAPVNNAMDFHDLRSILHSAVYFGDPEIVKKLLDKGADPNVYDRNDETPLVVAVKMEKNDITDLLLNAEGLQNCRNNENLTHLHIACMRNQVNIVKRLAQFDSDINAAVHHNSHNWPGYTALHFAVHFRSIETLEYLLSIRADITIGDSRTLSPLHLANMKRDERIMDLILLAHKNYPGNPEDSSGLSHFHIACTRNNPEIVDYLIEMGADSDEPIPSTGVKPKPNWEGSHAIDLAIYFECVDVVRLLLQRGDGAKSSYSDNDRIGAAYRTGNMVIVDLLMRREKQGDNFTITGSIPELHAACINHMRQTIREILLKTPSSLNSSTWKGNLPLHTAIECGFEEIAELLLLRGADYNRKNSQGKSSLHLAFERRMRKIENMILSDRQFFNQNPTNNDGLSHLHIACVRGHVRAVERFIEFGEDVNARVALSSASWPGFTPLHFAVEFHAAEVVQLLLANQVCYSMIDARNLSPFDIAVKRTRGSKNPYEIGRAFQVMSRILDAHHTRRLDSFNDRGFCCLHLIATTKEVGVDRAEKHIDERPSDVNKSVHKFNSLFDGWTPLHFAIKYDNIDLAKLLLAKGADILSRSGNGDTPLLMILSRRQSDDYLGMLHNFVRVHQSPVEVEGFPLFHLVCIAGNIDMIKHCLDNGADPNCVNMNNDMPLHLIVAGCCSPAVDVAKLLIDYGADPNGRGSRVSTPLHCLTNESQSDIIDLLVSHGANINARNAYTETPLLALCECAWALNPEQRVKFVASLLNNGSDINLEDELDTSPLMVPTWDPQDDESDVSPDLIQILLKHVTRLQVIGSRVSQSNLKACPTLRSRLPDELRFDEIQFSLECKKEFEAMKETRIDRYTTLHSILSKSLNELAVIEKNDVLRQILNSDDFSKKYPMYGPMLVSQFKKGAIRRPLLEKSCKALNVLLGIVSNKTLPNVCSERIFQYLDNHDLRNIIMSSGKLG